MIPVIEDSKKLPKFKTTEDGKITFDTFVKVEDLMDPSFQVDRENHMIVSQYGAVVRGYVLDENDDLKKDIIKFHELTFNGCKFRLEKERFPMQILENGDVLFSNYVLYLTNYQQLQEEKGKVYKKEM